MKQDIKITITGPNHSGKSAILSLLATVFQCMQSVEGKPLSFSIDPTAQTLLEGGLILENDLNTILNDLINQEKVHIILKDESESRIIIN